MGRPLGPCFSAPASYMLQTGHASPVFFVGYGSYQTFVEVVDLKIGDSKPASLGSNGSLKCNVA